MRLTCHKAQRAHSHTLGATAAASLITFGNNDPMLQLFPPAPGVVDDERLVSLYAWPDRPWVRANMVIALDGSARGGDGRSGSISSPADRSVLKLLRATCDALVVGAGTVRAENYGPPRVAPQFAAHRRALGLPELPMMVIVSNNLSVPADAPVFSRGRGTTVVLTSQNSDQQRRDELSEVTDIEVFEGASVSPTQALTWLRGNGWRRILTEGGPSLLGEWLPHLDEMCLSISPLMVGATSPPLPAPDLLAGRILAAPLGVSLQHLLLSEGMLIGAWRLAAHDPSAGQAVHAEEAAEEASGWAAP